MEEKIKIYVPQSVYNVLIKDMELFEFYKKDKSLNKNDFINTLILNYYEAYAKKNNEIYTYVKKLLEATTHESTTTNSQLAEDILHLIENKNNQSLDKKRDVAISIKPTKKSAATIEYICEYCLYGNTISNYFRNMFTFYSMFALNQRERIIFKEVFEIIEEAIETKKKIYFTTNTSKTKFVVSPYAIAHSKEELFNYVLTERNGEVATFRITRIKSPMIQKNNAHFVQNNIPIFEKMKEHDPQYVYDAYLGEIKVYLTEQGKKKFNKMYLYRPKVVRVEDNYYYFDCATSQAFQYFTRFGGDAIILEPQSLAILMQKYYQFGLKTYEKSLKENASEDQRFLNV